MFFLIEPTYLDMARVYAHDLMHYEMINSIFQLRCHKDFIRGLDLVDQGLIVIDLNGKHVMHEVIRSQLNIGNILTVEGFVDDAVF